MGPLSHIELLFHRFFGTGEYLIADTESHQAKIVIQGTAIKDHQSLIEIKGSKARDHQSLIVIKGAATKDHQILLDIWQPEEHIH